jgi:hypothetical protein
MMEVQQAMSDYLEVYFALYQRHPREVRDLGNNWVLVNGAHMRVTELQMLTLHLKRELASSRAAKRSVVQRLLKWFSTSPSDA